MITKSKMACVENIPPANGDSEMEEGEIVDELDDLSDISSEEEFLLRQRLQVLENYNNILERKKAKTSSVRSGKTEKSLDLLSQDLSEISATDIEETLPQISVHKNNGKYMKPKKRKLLISTVHAGKNKNAKKKSHRVKKKIMPKIVEESSEESDDEYRNKRRKLANAVVVHTPKSDTTSLRARLRKMFGTQSQEPVKAVLKETPKLEISNKNIPDNLSKIPDNIDEMNTLEIEKPLPEEILDSQTKMCEFIDLCNDTNDEEVMIVNSNVPAHVTVEAVEKNVKPDSKASSGDSDEDLELLRQHALKTKTNKTKLEQTKVTEKVEAEPENKQLALSEDEDSDTAELRLICLKSALLKKAIERKQKQKLRKRLSQSIHEDLIEDDTISRKIEAENNTDIESVDMDIGSDGDDKLKEVSDRCDLVENVMKNPTELSCILTSIPVPQSPHKEEFDEDEDLLRAKLLTSLSKNWPNLVDPAVVETLTDVPSPEVPVSTAKSKTNPPVEKPFIIKLGESDSEGEHEATKNLTKMHIKLSEQVDFQQKLDLFLKSTRMEVEKQALPDLVQQPIEQPKPVPKYVAKTVKHLPKSEQMEYKNLVRRMAELEKIKQARQLSMNLNKPSSPAKETLKPRNISVETTKLVTINNLEEQIAMSRKKIAEESAKMLKLKDEATKLSQKYKIVATELRNISTAITFNKKEQKFVQNRLTKIRLQHQTLIKSSTSSKHSNTNLPLVIRNSNKNMSVTKLQKENDPSKEEYKNPQVLKSVKVSVVNDLKSDISTNPKLSVQVDVSSNKKVVKMPKIPPKERTVDITQNVNNTEFTVLLTEVANPSIEKDDERRNKIEEEEVCYPSKTDEKQIDPIDDYKSPLEALHSGNWEEDPNSIMCRFEVGGSCKDPDCKYLHPNVPSDQ